jgi:uncharacterized RDD family membrane protein YckC
MKKCPYCGAEYSDDVALCTIDQQPLDVTPQEKTSNEDKSPSAGFGIRALARIVDTLFGLLIGIGAGTLAGVVIMLLGAAGVIAPGWQHRIHGFSLVSLGISLIGNIGYHLFCEGIHGATLGKLCCGICVVTEDMKPSNLKGAMIRTLAFYIDALFFGLVGYHSMSKSPLNQRYGDVWGKTAVVKVKELAPEARRTPTLFILGLLAGAGCWFVMLAMGLILKVF